MTGATGANLGLPTHWVDKSDGWGAVYNLGMLQLDTIVAGAVVSIANTPPGSPSDGDAYIIASSPTGAWSGKAKKVALWDGPSSAWVFFTQKVGMRLLNRADGNFYYYGTGAAWAVEAITGPAGPAPFGAETAWTTGTLYTAAAPASYVSQGGSSYVCLINHTAGTFATDLGAGKWGLVASIGATGATGSTGAAGTNGAVPFGTLAAWTTATAYTATAPASYVSINGSSYVCLTGHTSGTFATDLAAGKWGIVASAGAVNSLYDLSLFVGGVPTATQHLYSLMMARNVQLPANLSGAYGNCVTNPTATATITIKKNGTSCATISISTSGGFTFATSGGAVVNFSAGDQMDIYAQASPDATLADVAITIAAVRL